MRKNLIAAVPDLTGLRFQALHTDDAAAAYLAAASRQCISSALAGTDPAVPRQDLSIPLSGGRSSPKRERPYEHRK
ncbi:hypothetical protein [Streptomyces sp. NPDC056883]|uniref:hypothetical protein n=1 Tax=Streptomyces sp. NPDC056883 TaxID=3345959 RepID=UPI003696FE4E